MSDHSPSSEDEAAAAAQTAVEKVIRSGARTLDLSTAQFQLLRGLPRQISWLTDLQF